MGRLKFFGMEGLREFIRKMYERGFVVTAMDSEGIDVLKDSGIDLQGSSFEVTGDVAYQALNYEGTWVTFEKDDLKQSIFVLLTGDKYCDRIPIADWTFSKDKTKPDVIREVFDELDPSYCDSCGQKLPED